MNELVAAQKIYAQGNYEEAMAQFSNLLFQKENNLSKDDLNIVQFHYALSAFGNEKIEEAEEQFLLLSKNNNHSFTQQIQWYLALIALKRGDLRETRVRLKETLKIANQGKFAKHVKALLEELEGN